MRTYAQKLLETTVGTPPHAKLVCLTGFSRFRNDKLLSHTISPAVLTHVFTLYALAEQEGATGGRKKYFTLKRLDEMFKNANEEAKSDETNGAPLRAARRAPPPPRDHRRRRPRSSAALPHGRRSSTLPRHTSTLPRAQAPSSSSARRRSGS